MVSNNGLERTKMQDKIVIHGARAHNLKNIDVEFPIGVFTCVTGVSGSGKSSLVNSILNKELSNKLNRSKQKTGKFDRIEGYEKLDKVIEIDQSPIGRTPRSNPATYTKLFDNIRDVFAMTTKAKMKGYSKGRFSFNVKGGRCETCEGSGLKVIEMNPSQSPITILGCGSYGTALAISFSRNGSPTYLWGHNPEHINQMQQERQNRRTKTA